MHSISIFQKSSYAKNNIIILSDDYRAIFEAKQLYSPLTQVQQLQLSFEADQRPQQIKEKRRLTEQKAIDTRFDDHERFVSEVMTIEPAPYLKLVAVLHREA